MSSKPLLTDEILEQEMKAYCRLVPQHNNMRSDKKQPRFGQYILDNYDVSHLPINSVVIRSKEQNDDVYQELSMALFTFAVKGPVTKIPGAAAEIVALKPAVNSKNPVSDIVETIQGCNVVSLFP